MVSGVPGAFDDLADDMQFAVEEMVGARHDDHRQFLGAAQAITLARATVSSLAVDHQGVFRHRLGGCSCGRR